MDKKYYILSFHFIPYLFTEVDLLAKNVSSFFSSSSKHCDQSKLSESEQKRLPWCLCLSDSLIKGRPNGTTPPPTLPPPHTKTSPLSFFTELPKRFLECRVGNGVRDAQWKRKMNDIRLISYRRWDGWSSSSRTTDQKKSGGRRRSS